MSDARGVVRIDGLRELERAFKRIDSKLVKQLGDELKAIAEPVAATARSYMAWEFPHASDDTIKASRAGMSSAFVVQGARKVTGKRPDFGKQQMLKVLIPALEAHEDQIANDVDELLGRWGGEEGF